jgi:hypothetical protein
MKIPSNQAEKEQLVQYVIECCMASQEERRALYERRRRYFLYGQNSDVKVKFNRLKSHMKLVSSFLFSPDGLVYNIAPPRNADEKTIQQILALQDDWNEDVHDTGLGDTFAEAVTWGLNFDTMVVKMGWNDIKGHVFGRLVEPSSFGFWREDDPDFDSQQAMNHRFSLDYDEACRRLVKAGHADKIHLLSSVTEQPNETGLGDTMQAIIISAVQGTSINETISGRANVDFEAGPKFRAKLTAPMVSFDETWIWDSEADDYRIFHTLAEGKILLTDSAETVDAINKAAKEKGGETKYSSQTNWFLEKHNPFVPVTPFTLYNYAWGDAHMEDIIPLQDWSEERLTWIEEILQAQVDPLKIASGITGLIDEKSDLDYGAYYADDNPMAKVEEHRPPMPEDVFREFNEIGALMMEASGLTEVVSGKGSGGARGGQQQKQMQITGGGQIRKTAIGLEGALVRMGDIGLRLKMKNDDSHIKLPDGSEFVAAQAPEDFSLRVDGHSHSPLFTLENKELATMLFKAQAIDREWLLRMLNPTQKNSMLHSLKDREKAESTAREKQQQMEALKHAGKK